MAQPERPEESGQIKSQDSPSQARPKKLIISEIGTEKTFSKGTVIVRQGDTPENFYVVRKGKVKVFRLTEEGIRTDLTELGEGAYFGELAIVTGQPRSASVEAGEDTVLTEISREEFETLLDDNPPLARQIIKQLSQWLVEGDRRLEKQVVHQVKLRKVSWFDFALIGGLSIILALVFNLYNDNALPLVQGLDGAPVKVISLDEAKKLYNENKLVVIDARKEGFYRQEHIKGADNFQAVVFDLMYPMFQFKLEQKKVTKDSPIFVYGGTLSRRFDKDLARDLMSKGYENVMVLGSDYDAWRKSLSGGETEVHMLRQPCTWAWPVCWNGYPFLSSYLC